MEQVLSLKFFSAIYREEHINRSQMDEVIKKFIEMTLQSKLFFNWAHQDPRLATVLKV
jgi:hypothetical protein